MRERKTYRVELSVTRSVTYEVDAISPEEAELVAEDFLMDGEEPVAQEVTDVITTEVYPIDTENIS